MKSLNKNLTILSAIWVGALFVSLLNFNWWACSYVILGCPLWIDLGREINRARILRKYAPLIREVKKEVEEKTK
tara:strand:+ start:584 stop:805 length:222 start_codon:yes stop_codon:yes gene_type:complete